MQNILCLFTAWQSVTRYPTTVERTQPPVGDPKSLERQAAPFAVCGHHKVSFSSAVPVWPSITPFHDHTATMAAENANPTFDSQGVFEDLYETLAEYRTGNHIGRMAEHLLQRDSELRKLVGVIDDGQRAVYYNVFSRRLVSIQFGAHGLDDDQRDTIWGNLGDPAAWIDHNQQKIDWLHPRYRWALTLDEEQTTWGYWQ